MPHPLSYCLNGNAKKVVFVVKRHAVCKTKIRSYAVRKLRMKQYAARKGDVSPLESPAASYSNQIWRKEMPAGDFLLPLRVEGIIR